MSAWKDSGDRVENRILTLLPRAEYERLVPRLEPVTLEYEQVLCEEGEPIRDIYFPNSGVVSWLARVDHKKTVEVATIGNEGVVGFRVLLGAHTASAKVM